MRQQYNLFFTFGAFLLVVFLLPACTAQMKNYTGKTVQPLHALPAESGAGDWETNDLKIDYNVTDNTSVFLEGTIHFKSYLRYSFPLAEKFRLTIHYLDDNRTVLDSQDISPLIGYRRGIPERTDLPDAPKAPAGTRFFAFSYLGFLTGSNNSDENTGSWEISFNPFEKSR